MDRERASPALPHTYTMSGSLSPILGVEIRPER